jgi:predicted phosphodiesterase
MDFTRRKFVMTTAMLLGGASISGRILNSKKFKPVRFGIITDIHYADVPEIISMNRYYRQSLSKVSECVQVMNREKADFLIELGDLKDQGNPPEEQATLNYLSNIERELRKFEGPLYHVLGNHDHDSISKVQFLGSVANYGFSEALNFYSFNNNSFHFVVLDANYSANGEEYNHGNFDWTDSHLPENQLKWLIKDLNSNKLPSIVFIHHQLDSPGITDKRHCPDNADDARKIIGKAGNVIAVFQGHYHKGGLNKINNIFYYTLKAVVEGSGAENNNYAIVEIGEDLTVKIIGFRKTESTKLAREHG